MYSHSSKHWRYGMGQGGQGPALMELSFLRQIPAAASEPGLGEQGRRSGPFLKEV